LDGIEKSAMTVNFTVGAKVNVSLCSLVKSESTMMLRLSSNAESYLLQGGGRALGSLSVNPLTNNTFGIKNRLISTTIMSFLSFSPLRRYFVISQIAL
jgi:hypothetical protein